MCIENIYEFRIENCGCDQEKKLISVSIRPGFKQPNEKEKESKIEEEIKQSMLCSNSDKLNK